MHYGFLRKVEIFPVAKQPDDGTKWVFFWIMIYMILSNIPSPELPVFVTASSHWMSWHCTMAVPQLSYIGAWWTVGISGSLLDDFLPFTTHIHLYPLQLYYVFLANPPNHLSFQNLFC
jgi:hypothetical protein